MIVIFAGPTLSARGFELPPKTLLLPPVALGDVYRVVEDRPRVIAIVDGYFERTPSVSHKEILWALSNGIHVYGAASMGALRAAELHPFGMVGVGGIFEAYRDGVLQDDDEVAVAHGSKENSYRLASEAMVNIRATAERAVSEGVVNAADAGILVTAAKSLYYPLRSYPAMLERAISAGLPQETAHAFRDWVPSGRVDRKLGDALALFSVLGKLVSRRLPRKQIRFPFHRTQMWDFGMRHCHEETRKKAGQCIPYPGMIPRQPSGAPASPCFPNR